MPLQILDHIFDAAVGFNLKGEIVYFNHQASIFFKLPPRMLKSKSKLIQICEAGEFDLEEWVGRALLSFEVLISPEIQIHLVHDPQTEYSTILKLIPIDGHFVLLFQDKTLEKQLHNKYRDQVEELRKTHNQLLQTDKLTTIGELTANISHEINNPLTIAAGNSELIHELLMAPNITAEIPRLMQMSQVVMESLERVNQIIKNMKDFLHKSEDDKEYCDLEALLRQTNDWVTAAAKAAGVEVIHEFKAQKLVALANRIKLEQVLINLIKNSADAISAAGIDDGKIRIVLDKSESDQQILIDVIDNGPGLNEEIKANLFRPFQSTKEIGRGTGLGLSICQKIIEAHRGVLEHIPTEKGCHFRVRLPMVEAYSFTRNDRSLSGARTGNKKRILVLDNEVQILNVLNAYFKNEDFAFIGSSNPHDALSFLKRAHVDLVITDFSMPAMNGDEFAEKAREAGHEGPILYMTSAKYVEQYNRDKKNLSIDGLIIKPFNRDEVLKLVRLSFKAGKV